MTRRTYEADGRNVRSGDDLDELVTDKRSRWRATRAKARRRQRCYMNRLTRGVSAGGDVHDDNANDLS